MRAEFGTERKLQQSAARTVLDHWPRDVRDVQEQLARKRDRHGLTELEETTRRYIGIAQRYGTDAMERLARA